MTLVFERMVLLRARFLRLTLDCSVNSFGNPVPLGADADVARSKSGSKIAVEKENDENLLNTTSVFDGSFGGSPK